MKIPPSNDYYELQRPHFHSLFFFIRCNFTFDSTYKFYTDCFPVFGTLLITTRRPNILCAKIENSLFSDRRKRSFLYPLRFGIAHFKWQFFARRFFLGFCYVFLKIIEIDVVSCCCFVSRNGGLISLQDLNSRIHQNEIKNGTAPSSQTSSLKLEEHFFLFFEPC